MLLVRSRAGQEYLVILEWQGYPDLAVLWRVTGYLAWLGQQDPAGTVVAVIVYLTPACDIGNTITQQVDDETVLHLTIPCVRLWEQDAQAAIESGKVGLAVLSPLMGNATAALVEQAIDLVVQQTTLPQQADLFSILGVFSEPLMGYERFVSIIGKEKLMASDLLNYLVEEKTAELESAYVAKTAALEAKMATLEARTAAMEARINTNLQQALIEALGVRFQQVPAEALSTIWKIRDPERLSQLITEAVKATDIGTFTQKLEQVAHQGNGSSFV